MSLINKKKSMIIKETKNEKESSVKKERKTSKKIKNNFTLDSILENNENNEDDKDNKDKTFINFESQNNNLLDNNSNTNNDNNSNTNTNNDNDNDNDDDNIDEILQEINDSEIAIAMDASFASNIAMQLNNNIPIDEDMELILRQIQQKEILEEDEKTARKLQIENEINNTGALQEEDISDILEQIRIFEESEKLKAERQYIRELQDYEYEQSLQADMKPKNHINHINYENQVLDMPVPVAIQKEEIAIKTDTPLTVEEIRKARIAYYSKK
jgi:hypothetical protein